MDRLRRSVIRLKTIPQTNGGPSAPSSTVPVAIYARVSTDNQVGGRFDSCESQAGICREHLRRQKHLGWNEFVCLTDAAYSGGNMERPGMQELKRLIADGRVKVVLIYKLERVLRSTAEWGPFRAFLRQHDCLLESATESLSENTPSGRFKNNILISAAEYERENTAEKTRVKMREQAKRGYWNGGMVPFGYDYDANTQSLLPHPTEASLVRRMFDQTAKLVTPTDIANALNAEGHRTKSRVWKRRDGAQTEVGGNYFRDDGIKLILTNPIYRGTIRFAGEEYQGKHEALVTTELWERANAAVNKTPKAERPPLIVGQDKHGHLLKGLVVCGHCHRALIPHDSGKRAADNKPYRYYDCGQVARPSREIRCPVGRLPASSLEAAVVGFLGQLSQHPEVIQAALARSRSAQKIDREPIRDTLKAIDQALTDVGHQIRNCVDAIAAGGAGAITDELKERVAALQEKKHELIVSREKQRQDFRACDEETVAEKNIIAALHKLTAILPEMSAAGQKELLALFVNQIEVCAASRTTSSSRLEVLLHYEIGLPKLVASMQERFVRSGRPDSPVPATKHTMVLTSRVALGPQTKSGTSAILTPFEHLVTARSPESHDTSEPMRHAIHRALAWREQLHRDPTLQKQSIAAREKLTPAVISHHLKLLDLSPAIQQFLQELTDPVATHYFSLRKMRRLADLPIGEQKRVFHELQQNFKAGLSVS